MFIIWTKKGVIFNYYKIYGIIMKKPFIFIVCILILSVCPGCISQDGSSTQGTPAQTGDLNAYVDYVGGDMITVRNNESWAWQDTKLVLDDTYVCSLWDLGPGEEISMSVICFADGEGNRFDYLTQTGEKIVLTCTDPEGKTRVYYYSVSGAYSLVPPNVDSTPIRASELQDALTKYQAAYPFEGAQVQAMLDSLQALAAEQDPDYSAIEQLYSQYKLALQNYLQTLMRYFNATILAEYTTPTSGDLLELRKDKLPVARPDGKMCPLGNLELGAGKYYRYKDTLIPSLIQDGLQGQDVRQDLIDALAEFEEYLPGYYDLEIGYSYYSLSQKLQRQSQYSDVLINDCNPLCVYV
jgi:hypothetical protein